MKIEIQDAKIVRNAKVALLLFFSAPIDLMAGTLSSCYMEYPSIGRPKFWEIMHQQGGAEGNHCLDYEDSLFRFGDKLFFVYENRISESKAAYNSHPDSVGIADDPDFRTLSLRCYMVFALKTSNLSRKVDEKIKFNNGKTYTFFAESKKGTWLMRDEAGKCVYYKPSPPTPAKPKADAGPKSKAKDCEKGPNVPGLKPIQSVLNAN